MVVVLIAPRRGRQAKDKERLLAAENKSGCQESLVNSTLSPQSVPYDLMVIKAVEAQGWIWDCEGSVWLLQGATGEVGNAAAASGD